MTDIYEGAVKKIDPVKGHGFVDHSSFRPKDVYIHKDLVQKLNLKQGDWIRFEVVMELNPKSMQQMPQARNIERASKAEIKPAQAPANNFATQNDFIPLPYTFVPITPGNDKSRLFNVPGHDGMLNRIDAKTGSGTQTQQQNENTRLSGVLKFTLTAQTPLLVGARQYEFAPNSGSRYLPIDAGKTRKLLEPWRLPDGRVVLAGSSIKGMIRHHFSALLNAPMEKVGEQYFSYRPNLDVPKNQLGLELREALIYEVTDFDIKIKLLKPGRNAVFVRNGITLPENTIKQGQTISNAAIARNRNNEALPRLEKVKSGSWTADLAYRVCLYHGGIDGKGNMARQHDASSKTYNKVIIPEDSIPNESNSSTIYTLNVSDKVLEQYRNTYRQLRNTSHGHLSSRHPNVKDPENLIASQDDLPLLQANTLIYLELRAVSSDHGDNKSEIVSIGHHFRYRWAYRDSIRHLCVGTDDEQARPELALLEGETAGFDPVSDNQPKNTFTAQLSAARALFGYAQDSKLHGDRFKGNFERLAGRIAINHALEVLAAEPEDSALQQRFVSRESSSTDLNEDDFLLPLKELGSPKASAVEFYIQQHPQDHQNGLLSTYGDLSDAEASRLAGRKFYRHQPAVNKNQALYLAEAEELNNDRAILARWASKPGTRFRFSLRFRDLSQVELGALLFLLDLHNADAHLGTTEQSPISANAAHNPKYALKLGHARPLGWGSVTTQLDAATMINNTTKPEDLYSEPTDITAWKSNLIKHFSNNKNMLAPNLAACLAAWSFRDMKYAAYPELADSKGNKTIFNFHTSLRRQHAKARRGARSRFNNTDIAKPDYRKR